MAGFQVSSQTFGSVDKVSNGLLPDSDVSGLMGLAFQTIASSGAKPFWQALVDSGAWTQPLMSFVLTRYDNLRQGVKDLLPGGRFTMGE
jgi:cathepsin D